MRWVMALCTLIGGAACEATNSVSYHYPAIAGEGGSGFAGSGTAGSDSVSGTSATTGALGGAAAGEPSSSAGEPQTGGGAAAGAPAVDGGAAGAGGVASACTLAADCGQKSDCAIPTCHNGSCNVVLVPEGSFVRFDETPCHALVCDGSGNPKLVVDTRNPPGTTHDCSVLSCAQDGRVVETQAPLGAGCGESYAQRCDVAGDCVDCIAKQDCQGDLACIAGQCQTPDDNCNDQHKGGSETDVDCGGKTCAPCGVGAECYADTDCATQACDYFAPGRCLASHCLDRHRNGDETDQDCGGPTCEPCQATKECKLDSDCTSGLCHPKFHFCLDDHCSNKLEDGPEMGVDCGGGCYGCPTGNDCSVDFDCLSQSCDAISAKCLADQCQDHHHNGSETDIDCGGPTCAPCGVGRKCSVTSDCAPGINCGGIPKTCYGP